MDPRFLTHCYHGVPLLETCLECGLLAQCLFAPRRHPDFRYGFYTDERPG